MTQLETASLGKQGRTEAVHRRTGVTPWVDFSKVLAATSIQMQDVHRDLNQNPGSDPGRRLGLEFLN